MKPILDYGAEICSFGKEIKELESVQLGFIKMLLGVKSSTSSNAIYAETGRYPIHINYCVKIMKYYYRLTNLKDSQIVKKVFLELNRLDELGLCTNNWVSVAKGIFIRYGLNCEDIKEMSITSFEKCVNEKRDEMKLIFENKCMLDIKEAPILRTFCKFKTKFGLEPYLQCIKKYKIRSVVSKFRLSSHNLQIEKGRHHKPKLPLEERICVHCNLAEVEDEFHFFSRCTLYNDIRDTFFMLCNNKLNYNFMCLTQEEKFKIVMTEDNLQWLLGMFLRKCFKIRTEVYITCSLLLTGNF